MRDSYIEKLFWSSVFVEQSKTPEEILEMYPKRLINENAIVTRIAPSPTWFMHIWTLYTALICKKLANQSGWVFFLRMEDTDKKREVEWSDALIIQTLDYYGLTIDEWPYFDWWNILSKWNYWPYRQSHRKEIYQAFIKELIKKWYAYPCFCSNEELEAMREEQKDMKTKPWYYGKWAKWRNATDKEILEELEKGTSFTIRYKSNGTIDKNIVFDDIIKWRMEMPENDIDVVIMKADWLPTYHFAHVVDDHLMWATHVMRGDEWLASVPLHLQMFFTMWWTPPLYWHLAPVQKMDGNSKRKLSKRKDPEANILYYQELWFPKQAILKYLLNLASSDFYEWDKNNPNADLDNFHLTFERLANSNGPLLDFTKLTHTSKEIIAEYTAEDVYNNSLVWAEKEDKQLFDLLKQNKEYCLKIFNIERLWEKPRKDIGKWSDIKEEIRYFFEELHIVDTQKILEMMPSLTIDSIKSILKDFLETYDIADSKEIWFNKIKEICVKNWFADAIKLYKQNKEAYKWSIVDVSNIIRFSITWRISSPDIYEIMKIMWADKVNQRILEFIK